MMSRRLRAPNRAPSALFVETGFVKGYRLTFDKVSSDGSGKCDIEITNSSDGRVYGVLYAISKTDKLTLDKVEGLGRGYREEVIDISTPSGTYKATTYLAITKEPTIKPYDWYKQIVIAGALEHGLPGLYVEGLKTVDAIPDPDISRRSEEEIVFGS